jgi:hypothetical protein
MPNFRSYRKHVWITSGFLLFAAAFCGACKESSIAGQGARVRDAESQLRDAAKGANFSDALRQSAMQRDPEAAQELEAKYVSDARKEADRKPGTLVQSELIRLLVLDYDRPEYHVQLAETHLADLSKEDETKVPAAESIWQHLEWLRLKQVDAALSGRVEALKKKVPLRPAEATRITGGTLSAARKTFLSGMPIHIEYPSQKPIEFETGGSFTINQANVRLSYVRSPEWPPNGCRVVAYMFVSKDGGKPEPNGMHRNYEPCAFTTGLLDAGYMAFGRIELKPETKLFIHVESVFETKDRRGSVISNTLEIPVVAKK